MKQEKEEKAPYMLKSLAKRMLNTDLLQQKNFVTFMERMQYTCLPTDM